MNASLTLACLIAAGVGLVVQNTLMVRITQSASTILIAMLLNSLVGIVIFVTMLLLRQGVAGFQELALSVKWWTLIPGLLGSFFVFASISGYQTVGAATTIAVLVASQLVGGLIMDLVRAHGVPVRALIGPLCGAVMLVVGGLFGLVGSFGLLKLKLPMQRLHGPTKAVTMGVDTAAAGAGLGLASGGVTGVPVRRWAAASRRCRRSWRSGAKRTARSYSSSAVAVSPPASSWRA